MKKIIMIGLLTMGLLLSTTGCVEIGDTNIDGSYNTDNSTDNSITSEGDEFSECESLTSPEIRITITDATMTCSQDLGVATIMSESYSVSKVSDGEVDDVKELSDASGVVTQTFTLTSVDEGKSLACKSDFRLDCGSDKESISESIVY